MRPAIRCAAVAVCLLALATSVRAELAPWDPAKVTELAKQLDVEAAALFDAFRRQPQPTAGSGQRVPYFRLAQEIRFLRRESRTMSRALQRGASQEEALASWESLMLTVRRASDNARRVFTLRDVQQRADAVREILNQLAPYFDPNATPLEAPARR